MPERAVCAKQETGLQLLRDRLPRTLYWVPEQTLCARMTLSLRSVCLGLLAVRLIPVLV